VTGQGRWEETIPTETPHVLVCQGSDEWSALYVDGELVRHGDHYLIDEQLRVLFDVITVTTNAFVVTNKQGREVACQTLDEIRNLSERGWNSPRKRLRSVPRPSGYSLRRRH
jgi:hypothetical protein